MRYRNARRSAERAAAEAALTSSTNENPPDPTPETPPHYPTLDYPVDGVPPVTNTAQAYEVARTELVGGSGPLALDTERAHGFRYSPKAYLIQFRRAGAGTVLLDPVAFEDGRPRADFSALADDLADVEWVLHAAGQDLPCLAEVGLLPHRLFDTELAARLLGFPKVNLSAVMERAFGIGLRKEHSADDWSTRPLPAAWLVYAALDVERLVDLRDWVDDQLSQAGKRDWAAQEFAYLVEHATDVAAPRTDPWRRTSGLHEVRSRRGLEVVRDLWEARDGIAARLDIAPARILHDRAIIGMASVFDREEPVVSASLLRRVPGFAMRRAARFERDWLAALQSAAARPKGSLPVKNSSREGPPPPRAWENRFPDSFARWNRVRPALIALAERVDVPVENLLAPDALRGLLWNAPSSTSVAEIDARLAALEARPWQRELVADVIAAQW